MMSEEMKLTFKVRHHIWLCSLLESQDGAGLELQRIPALASETLCHLPNQPLEREEREEETPGFLVVPDFEKGSGLHTS
jgi:hypothetical protein